MENKVVILNAGDDASIVPSEYKIVWRNPNAGYETDENLELVAKSTTLTEDDIVDAADDETVLPNDDNESKTYVQADPPTLLPPDIDPSSIVPTYRILPDGTTVVDIEFDLTTVDNAATYEARFT